MLVHIVLTPSSISLFVTADTKNLKVVCGLQRHYQNSYLETLAQVKEGLIGDIINSQVYWSGGGVWTRPRKEGMTEMEYQMRNWYYFNWICGDHIVEQHIHNLDVGNWFKGAVPVKANGIGGRTKRIGKDWGEIYDHHYVEYTYENGVRVNSQCRHQSGVANAVREEFTGTKGKIYLDNSGRCYVNNLKGETIWKYRPGGMSCESSAGSLKSRLLINLYTLSPCSILLRNISLSQTF